MINLPYDIERCTGEACPARYDCARYTSPGEPSGRQPMAQPEHVGPEGCRKKIDNGRRQT